MKRDDTIQWILTTQVPDKLPHKLPPIADWPEKLQVRLKKAIEGALDHHVEQYRVLSKAHSETEIARQLAMGRFAQRPFPDCNLWHDLSLAVGLGGFVQGAVALFQSRFDPQVSSWASELSYFRSQSADGYREVRDEFLGVLVARVDKVNKEGRTVERPAPIETYAGKAPLVGWLKVTFQRRAQRSAKRMAIGEDKESGTPDRPIEESKDQVDCRKMFREILAPMLDTLEIDDRAMLEMAVLDNVPKKRVAQLFGIHPGNVTRKIEAALVRLEKGLQEFAKNAPKRCGRRCASVRRYWSGRCSGAERRNETGE